MHHFSCANPLIPFDNPCICFPCLLCVPLWLMLGERRSEKFDKVENQLYMIAHGQWQN